jgi:hypothetical protein
MVTLTATPGPGSSFSGWSGAGCSGTGTCIVTLDASKSVTATFSAVQAFQLTVSRTGDAAGGGSVASAPGGINCGGTCAANFDSPTVVTLTAVAGAGSAFTGWTGEGCSGTGTCQVTMSQARSVSASFTLTPSADSDNDNIPNSVEVTEGRNPFLKDNDIFTSPRLFAMQVYRDFLGREGEAAGVDFYANLIAAGTVHRANVIESFFNSPEFAGRVSPVVRLYFATFQRIPDYPGLIFQVGVFRSGQPLSAIANSFTQSPEFLATYGALDNAQFVSLLYTNILGRAASQAEIDFHVARLVGGTTRGGVLVGFSESPEYRQLTNNDVYVTMMYVGMLRRAPEQAGFDFWTNYMDTGNPGINLILGFLNAPEFRNRFLPP